ncbi:hypothetical protein CR513_22488, partial [Mucuna pruriens]
MEIEDQLETQLSMHGIVGLTTRKSLKVWGSLKGCSMIVLINCRATHNFITTELVSRLKLQGERTQSSGLAELGEIKANVNDLALKLKMNDQPKITTNLGSLICRCLCPQRKFVLPLAHTCNHTAYVLSILKLLPNQSHELFKRTITNKHQISPFKPHAIKVSLPAAIASNSPLSSIGTLRIFPLWFNPSLKQVKIRIVLQLAGLEYLIIQTTPTFSTSNGINQTHNKNSVKRKRSLPPELFDGIEGVDLAKRGSPSSALFGFGLVVAPKRPFPLKFVLQPCLRCRCRRRRNHIIACCCHLSLNVSLPTTLCRIMRLCFEGLVFGPNSVAQ